MAFSGKAAVLMGGSGSERDISLQSGQNVLNALACENIEAIGIDITPEDITALDDKSIDIFFIMLHGRWGEDGGIQKILEDKGFSFTGSGSKASGLAFDKIASKEIFAANQILTPDWIAVDTDSDFNSLEQNFSCQGDKFVVKPACEGSSVGIEIRTGRLAAIRAAEDCARKHGKSLIEQYIPAKEFTVGIVDNIALPIIEIRPKTGFYDFTAKYISDDTQYLFDTIGKPDIIADMQQCALKCFDLLGCKGFARVDFLMKPDGKFYVLEINTIPGFTSHSLLPKAALKYGLSQGQLCRKIIETAVKG